MFLFTRKALPVPAGAWSQLRLSRAFRVWSVLLHRGCACLRS